MSERTDERTVESEDIDLDGLDDGGDVGLDEDELGVDVDSLAGDPVEADAGGADHAGAQGGSSGPGLLSRLRPSLGLPNPAAALPSAREALVAFAVVVVSMFAGSAVPLLGPVGGLLGVFAGAFVLGLVSGKSRYLELAVAGAAAAGLAAFLSTFAFAVATDSGVPIAAFGAGGGLVATVLGHYFGRDLRSGLTRDVE